MAVRKTHPSQAPSDIYIASPTSGAPLDLSEPIVVKGTARGEIEIISSGNDGKPGPRIPIRVGRVTFTLVGSGQQTDLALSPEGDVSVSFTSQPFLLPSIGSHQIEVTSYLEHNLNTQFASTTVTVVVQDWSAPSPTNQGETSTGPAATSFNGRLYFVWKGQGGDQRLYWASSDGTSWTAQQPFVGSTTDRPALAVHNGRLYAAWKGMVTNGIDDPAIHWASFDGTNWINGGSNGYIAGSNTNVGPALAELNGQLYAVWKDASDPQQSMKWSVLA
jgi:hypothetical protein